MTKIKKLKEMFDKMVVHKNAALIPEYYDQDFLLFTNEKQMDYDEFLKSHIKYYKTPIQYQVDYDEETLLEDKDKVAGRIWITIKMPNEKPKKIEVILIVTYKEGKIYRLWELSFPDWAKLNEFAKR